MTRTPVLVTGGSGFIAGHMIAQLLAEGHTVRATLRSLDREAAVRSVLRDAGVVDDGDLEFVAADLRSDEGWTDAVTGVSEVFHVASPVQPGRVDDEDALIVPAREGTVRVLRAARDAGVRRIVLTSAFHAVSWGHPHDEHVFTEDDWTVLDGPGVDAYGKSKTLAERAAWDFVAAEGRGLELVAMLPVAVMGPVMGDAVSGSNHIVQSMLDGAMPAVPRLFIPVVDVRDVAAAHLRAMAEPDAAGQRFLISSGPVLPLREIAATVRDAVGDAGARVPRRTMPDLVVRVAALVNPALRGSVPDLGYRKRLTNAKARRMLGWSPRDPHEAIADAARSMVARGLVPSASSIIEG